MSRKAMKESLTIDLKHQLEAHQITQDMHAKAMHIIHGFSAADWKDIDNMSTVAASDMVLEIARSKESLPNV